MSPAPLTRRGWNRALLARQLLLERQDLDVVEAVRRVLVVQSQSPPSAYLALWNRVADLDLDELDTAYAAGSLVKASLLRVTLQTVAAEDLPTLRSAMAATLASRLGDQRFVDAGVARDEALAAAPDFLARLREPRTNAQMETWTQQRFGRHPTPSVWWAMRYLLPLAHAPTGGPWSFGAKPAHVAVAGSRSPASPDPGEEVAAQAEMVRRYLAAFGPASVADVAAFTTQRRGPVRPALARLGEEVRQVAGPDGPLWDLADPDLALQPDPETPAPARLLGMWDDALLGNADRSRTLPTEMKQAVVRVNGDVLPTLLVDGHVAGTWRVVEAGGRHRVEAHALRSVAEPDWEDLEREAEALLPALGAREQAPYARYDHWWDKAMPAQEVRLLG